MNFNHYFNMGGYALYVWPAYFITFIVFAMNVFFSLRDKKQIKKIILKSLRSMK